MKTNFEHEVFDPRYVESLERDRQRLEWLVSNHLRAVSVEGEWHIRFAYDDGLEERITYFAHESWRDAIDEGMMNQGAGKEIRQSNNDLSTKLPACSECGSTDLAWDATVYQCANTGAFYVSDVLPCRPICDHCGDEVSIVTPSETDAGMRV